MALFHGAVAAYELTRVWDLIITELTGDGTSLWALHGDRNHFLWQENVANPGVKHSKDTATI